MSVAIRRLKKRQKKANSKSAVTPTYGGFRRNELNTVVDSAKRIFLRKAIVQGRSTSGSCARQLRKLQKRQKGKINKNDHNSNAQRFLDTHS